MSPALYNKTGFKPAAYVTDHGMCSHVSAFESMLKRQRLVIPQASKDLLAALPGIETVEITAKFPIVESQ